MAYNVLDISARLAKLRCCISEKAQTVALKKKYGTAKKKDTNTLIVLVAFEQIISRYVVGSTNNLITETQLDNIFDMIQRICNLAFAPKGYNYFENVPVAPSNAILLENGDYLLLENDDLILLN